MKPAARRRTLGGSRPLTTITLSPTADTLLNSEATGTNYSTNVLNFVQMPYGTGPGSYGRPSLLQFDISSLAGATVTTAPLAMTVANSGGGGSVGVNDAYLQARRVLRAVDISTCTFNNYDATHAWQTPGAAGALDCSTSHVTNGELMDNETLGTVRHVDLVDIINDALGAGQTTLTVLLCGSTYMNDSNAILFGSIENATPAYRPVLSVTYA